MYIKSANLQNSFSILDFYSQWILYSTEDNGESIFIQNFTLPFINSKRA